MTSRPHGIDGWGYPNQEYAPEPRVMDQAPRCALVVTPHPDDAEGGCGATMAKWIAESGTKVVILMCTNGNKGTGDRSFTPESLAATREVEQQNASNVLGVAEVVFLRYGDGELEDTHEYRGEVVRQIRKHKPEVVFGIDPYRVTSHTTATTGTAARPPSTPHSPTPGAGWTSPSRLPTRAWNPTRCARPCSGAPSAPIPSSP